jgi:hypothetical protein
MNIFILSSYFTCKKNDLKIKDKKNYYKKMQCVILNKGTESFCRRIEAKLEAALLTEGVGYSSDEGESEAEEDEVNYDEQNTSTRKRPKIPDSESNFSMANEYLKNMKKQKIISITEQLENNDINEPFTESNNRPVKKPQVIDPRSTASSQRQVSPFKDLSSRRARTPSPSIRTLTPSPESPPTATPKPFMTPMALSERADRLLESDDSNDGSILNDNKFKTNVIKFLRNILTKMKVLKA